MDFTGFWGAVLEVGGRFYVRWRIGEGLPSPVFFGGLMILLLGQMGYFISETRSIGIVVRLHFLPPFAFLFVDGVPLHFLLRLLACCMRALPCPAFPPTP